MKDLASVRGTRAGQYLPQELSELAAKMGSLPAATISSVLRDEAVKNGIPVTWDDSFIYDNFVRIKDGSDFDFTEAVE